MRKVKCIILLTIIFFITGCSGGKGDNIENIEISKDAGIQLNEDDFNVLNSGGEIGLAMPIEEALMDSSESLQESIYVGEIYVDEIAYKYFMHEDENVTIYSSNLYYDRNDRDFNEYYIAQISLKTAEYMTPRGITIGSALDEVVSVYGQGETSQEGAIKILNYSWNEWGLKFSFDKAQRVECIVMYIQTKQDAEDKKILDMQGDFYESERVDKNEDSQDIVKEKQYTFPLETTEADYEIVTATYEQGKIKIQYPQVSGLADEEKQNAINELIREDLLKTQVDEVLEGLENDYYEIELFKELEYEIALQTSDILSVLYTGSSQEISPAASDYYWYIVDAITIDIENVKKLELADFVDVDEELVKRIKECDNYTNGVISSEEEKEDLQTVIQGEQEEYIIKRLLKCEGPYQFCVTPDALIVSIGTVHAGGDYILFTLQNDDSNE